jgi:hypothetical protein
MYIAHIINIIYIVHKSETVGTGFAYFLVTRTPGSWTPEDPTTQALSTYYANKSMAGVASKTILTEHAIML